MSDKLVNDMAVFMCEHGQECYPFSTENFAEALANIPDKKYAMLAELAEMVHQGDSLSKNVMADYIVNVVTHYWRDIALYIAEKRTPNA